MHVSLCSGESLFPSCCWRLFVAFPVVSLEDKVMASHHALAVLALFLISSSFALVR